MTIENNSFKISRHKSFSRNISIYATATHVVAIKSQTAAAARTICTRTIYGHASGEKINECWKHYKKSKIKKHKTMLCEACETVDDDSHTYHLKGAKITHFSHSVTSDRRRAVNIHS